MGKKNCSRNSSEKFHFRMCCGLDMVECVPSRVPVLAAVIVRGHGTLEERKSLGQLGGTSFRRDHGAQLLWLLGISSSCTWFYHDDTICNEGFYEAEQKLPLCPQTSRTVSTISFFPFITVCFRYLIILSKNNLIQPSLGECCWEDQKCWVVGAELSNYKQGLYRQ